MEVYTRINLAAQEQPSLPLSYHTTPHLSLFYFLVGYSMGGSKVSSQSDRFPFDTNIRVLLPARNER